MNKFYCPTFASSRIWLKNSQTAYATRYKTYINLGIEENVIGGHHTCFLDLT